MEIAATGLIPLPLPGFDRGRQVRAEADQQSRSRHLSNPQNNPSRDERLVRGEVISSSQANPRRVNSAARAINERNAAFGQSDTRRFSLQAAIQAFKDNEALIASPGEKRQISGIIDEFV